jgi:hypothetical protein
MAVEDVAGNAAWYGDMDSDYADSALGKLLPHWDSGSTVEVKM